MPVCFPALVSMRCLDEECIMVSKCTAGSARVLFAMTLLVFDRS
jgi:hypothetical protein